MKPPEEVPELRLMWTFDRAVTEVRGTQSVPSMQMWMLTEAPFPVAELGVAS
jgi:hypothetical protein